MKKPVNLDEFLGGKSLDEFLPPPEPDLPREVLGPPELVTIHWRQSTCSCGRVYESEEHGPTIRHTISRRMGFGLREVGKVYIPAIPGLDLSEIPTETRITQARIFACPQCIGARPSLPLFPDQPTSFVVKANGNAMSPHAARWLDMHATAAPHALDQTMAGMHRRGVDFDDLLTFKTESIDLMSLIQSTCDPERQIELE